jgi:nucleoid-associated protein YgaU
VGPGDTLSQIAKQIYGSERYWKHIWEANKKVISDPNRLPQGCKLLIPKLAEPAD